MRTGICQNKWTPKLRAFALVSHQPTPEAVLSRQKHPSDLPLRTSPSPKSCRMPGESHPQLPARGIANRHHSLLPPAGAIPALPGPRRRLLQSTQVLLCQPDFISGVPFFFRPPLVVAFVLVSEIWRPKGPGSPRPDARRATSSRFRAAFSQRSLRPQGNPRKTRGPFK